METRVIEISDYELERNKPMPSKFHARIQTRLIVIISKFYDNIFDIFSELEIELNYERSVPDISLFFKGQIDFTFDEIRVPQTPVLTIEILSPTQALEDLLIRMRKNIDNGVKSVWIVLPETKTVFVFNHKKQQSTFIQDSIIDKELEIKINMDELFV